MSLVEVLVKVDVREVRPAACLWSFISRQHVNRVIVFRIDLSKCLFCLNRNIRVMWHALFESAPILVL